MQSLYVNEPSTDFDPSADCKSSISVGRYTGHSARYYTV